MTLDEQLAMATGSVPVAPQPNNAQVQAEAQVVQPTVTTASTGPVTTMETQVQQVAPTQATAGLAQTFNPAPAQASTPALSTGINLEQAVQEAETQYAVQEITLGQVVSSRAIDPLKRLEKGEKFRFTLLTNTIKAAKVHNHETLNKLICWSTDSHLGQCCKDMDQPKVRYYMPVLVYGTMPGDPNTPLPQAKSELRLMIIWDADSYKQLCEEVVNAGGDVTRIDLVATVDDSYGRLSFRAQNTTFRDMKEYQQVIADSTAKWEVIKDKAEFTVGRKLDDERYLKLTQKVVPPVMQDYSAEDALR